MTWFEVSWQRRDVLGNCLRQGIEQLEQMQLLEMRSSTTLTNMQTGGPGDWTSNPLSSGQPTPPPEPELPECYVLIIMSVSTYVSLRRRRARVAVHDYMCVNGLFVCTYVMFVQLCRRVCVCVCVCACHTSVAVCSNLRSQLGAPSNYSDATFCSDIKSLHLADMKQQRTR